jgi:hypothetical protein
MKSVLVPLAGIEPALLAELDFESSASTNSATGALTVHGRDGAIYSAGYSSVNMNAATLPEQSGLQRPFEQMRDLPNDAAPKQQDADDKY